MPGLRWTFLALPLLLGGCFVPLPVTLASLSLSGIAYVDSGKTMPEHALSAAMDQDCSFLRMLSKDGPMCHSGIEANEILLAGGPIERTSDEVHNCEAPAARATECTGLVP